MLTSLTNLASPAGGFLLLPVVLNFVPVGYIFLCPTEIPVVEWQFTIFLLVLTANICSFQQTYYFSQQKLFSCQQLPFFYLLDLIFFRHLFPICFLPYTVNLSWFFFLVVFFFDIKIYIIKFTSFFLNFSKKYFPQDGVFWFFAVPAPSHPIYRETHGHPNRR